MRSAMGLRRLLYLLPVLVFVGVGIGLAVGLTRDPSTLPSALIDKPVPTFALPPIEGMPGEGLSSADLEGQVSLVNVFASWCVPCRSEHPLLMALAERGVLINGIDYKDPAEQAAAWLAELGNPFARIGADRDGRVAIDFGVYGVPETFVVDREGRIRHKHVGPLRARDVEEMLLPMLEQLGRERDSLQEAGGGQ
jgi:cytochrome c biogenesis protein CcmG, thiol:disulfide interchange protein DsbE